ncbi:MAG: hypothetical protein IT536_13200 [Hyphomicrobiales bacterium]|nr:hypothetical protein [Hyphomicrobiales bacterium]
MAGSDWIDVSRQRIGAARVPLGVTAAVMAALWLVGWLPAAAAWAAWVVVAGAILAVGPSGVGPGAQAPALVQFEPAPLPALLDAVLAALPQPVIVLDDRGDVVAVNPPARQLVPALRAGEPVSLMLRMPVVLEAIRRAVAGGMPQRVEFTLRLPVERWFAAVVVPLAVPIEAARPPVRLVLITLDDLTALRRVEEMRADFVANASHELRTPLAALSGFIETLQGPARDDAAARDRFLSIMHAQATRMARLIDDLLSLSRIELNAHRRPDSPVDLTGIIRQVVDGLQTLARDREIEILVQSAAGSVQVLGDRDELLRVFENLVENALKYGASGKRVDVAFVVDTTKREVRVAVRDYGPGIAPEHLPRLTERFYRVDVADSRAQGGTGLGLALVKHILNRHAGRLTVDSAPGAGATFTAVLPLPAAAAATPPG